MIPKKMRVCFLIASALAVFPWCGCNGANGTSFPDGGTDGTDGPTDAAGGIATPSTVARGKAQGLDARDFLAANDSYHYLAALGDLLITGPTQTNVNDLVFLFNAKS